MFKVFIICSVAEYAWETERMMWFEEQGKKLSLPSYAQYAASDKREDLHDEIMTMLSAEGNCKAVDFIDVSENERVYVANHSHIFRIEQHNEAFMMDMEKRDMQLETMTKATMAKLTPEAKTLLQAAAALIEKHAICFPALKPEPAPKLAPKLKAKGQPQAKALAKA